MIDSRQITPQKARLLFCELLARCRGVAEGRAGSSERPTDRPPADPDGGRPVLRALIACFLLRRDAWTWRRNTNQPRRNTNQRHKNGHRAVIDGPGCKW